MELPSSAISLLGLGKLSLIPFEEATNILSLIAMDIAILDYNAATQKSDHYLLRDAPYSVVRGECKSANLSRSFGDATHYSLGPSHSVEYVEADRNRSARFTSYTPIVFWKAKLKSS